ncbi:MAG: exopolyphosphatase [Raoultibacter sp.]
MPNYGIIDLGSNTVRSCIYEVKDDTRKTYRKKKDFQSLINHKIMAGLASHVIEGTMTAQGIDHAVSVLNGHLRRAEYFKCTRLDIFATAVLRNCTNSAEATAAIEARIRKPICLLSAADEAHLGFVGASSAAAIEEGTLVDIGGGSTELTRITKGRDFDNISIGQGSLSSFADGVRAILPTPQEADAITASFQQKFDQSASSALYRHPRLFGVGGSVRAAAKMYAEITGTINRPDTLLPAHVDEIIALYRKDPDAFGHLALKAVPDRINTLLPGCLLLKQIMYDCGTENLCICKGGVREGYLIERILQGQPGTQSR